MKSYNYKYKDEKKNKQKIKKKTLRIKNLNYTKDINSFKRLNLSK